MSRTSDSGGRRVLARERERRAIELRRAGQTYDAIAVELGCTRGAAFKVVQRVLVRLAAEAREDGEAVRAIELDRLDALHAIVWEKAAAGDLAAVDRALRIAERRAKLLGLDAPVRRELTGRDGVPLLDVAALVYAEGLLDVDEQPFAEVEAVAPLPRIGNAVR